MSATVRSLILSVVEGNALYASVVNLPCKAPTLARVALVSDTIQTCILSKSVLVIFLIQFRYVARPGAHVFLPIFTRHGVLLWFVILSWYVIQDFNDSAGASTVVRSHRYRLVCDLFGSLNLRSVWKVPCRGHTYIFPTLLASWRLTVGGQLGVCLLVS